jgi:hypothetical protein
MHYRFLVTFAAEDADDSHAARGHVAMCLAEEGFCSVGRWGSGMADWFVIGGRWSGELSRATWARRVTAEMDALEKEHGVQVWGAFYGSTEKERIQQELAARFQRMWDQHAPEEYKGIPFQRDTYREDGYADDAMLLTQELYDALLKEYEGTEDFEYHADLEYEPITPDMVGKKWLVVVDYHS